MSEDEAEGSLKAMARIRAKEILLGALKSKENPAAVGKVLQSVFEKESMQEGVRQAVYEGLRSKDCFDSANYQSKWWYDYYVNPKGGAFRYSTEWLADMTQWWLLHPESIRITTKPLVIWSLEQDFNVKRIALNSAMNIPYNMEYTIETMKFNVVDVLKNQETIRQTTSLLIEQLQSRK